MFLVRDLVSPRTWLAMTSHLAGLFTGLAVMVVVVTGLSLGFSLVVLALVGLPLLGRRSPRPPRRSGQKIASRTPIAV